MSKLILSLWIFIFCLILTGGYQSASFEIAQVDFFGIVLLLLVGLRFFYYKKILSKNEERFFQKVLKNVALNSTKWIFTISIGISFFIYVLQWLRFYHFELNAFDFGFTAQSIWSFTQPPPLPFLYSTLSKGNTYLGEHFSPILALVALPGFIWQSPGWIFLTQGLLVGSGIFLAHLYSKKIGINQGLSCLLAASLFLYQACRGTAFCDFREDLFFIPAFFGILLFIESKQWTWFYLALCASFLIKENAPILGMLISFYLFTKNHRKHSVLTFITSVIVFVVVSKFVLPRFSEVVGDTLLDHRLRGFGIDGIEEFKKLLFTNPFSIVMRFIQHKVSTQTLKYGILIFLPLLPFISLKNKRQLPLLVILLVMFLMNLAIGSQKLGFHYEAVLLPFYFVLLAEGLRFTRTAQMQIRKFYIYLILVFCVFGRSPMLYFQKWWPTAQHFDGVDFLSKIPSNYSVATQSAFFPQLLERKDIKLLSPQNSQGFDLIVYSKDSSISRYANPELDATVASLEHFGYKTAYQSNLVHVLCKKEVCSQWVK